MKKTSEEKNLTTTNVESLSNELLTKLSSKEVKIQHVSDKRSRRKIVNWNYVADWCISMKWINIKMIQEHVESTYNKKELHYSEALRFLRSNKLNKVVKIVIKEIESGEHKGIYYNLTKRK